MKGCCKILKITSIVALFGMLMGCAAQNQDCSGFLRDYPPFEAGLGGVDKRYIKEGDDFSRYRKIMMDEVVFFFKEESDYKGIHPDEINELSREFHKAFIETLGDRLTESPGHDVLRMRLAVRDLETSNPVSSTMSTVIPVGLAVNLVKKGTTVEYIGVGSASMEAEFLDSMSNERIAVVVDKAPGARLMPLQPKYGINSR